jgi:hypothetical protein
MTLSNAMSTAAEYVASTVLEGSMTVSNDEFAALGLGLGVGTGATLISPAFGIGMGAGMVAILYATQQKRNEVEYWREA